jgi:hypothetical protein
MQSVKDLQLSVCSFPTPVVLVVALARSTSAIATVRPEFPKPVVLPKARERTEHDSRFAQIPTGLGKNFSE